MLRSFCSDSRSGKQNQPSSTLLKMDFCVRVVWFDLACGTWSQNLNLFFFGKIESLFWGQLVECDWRGGDLFCIFPPPVTGCWISGTPWSLFSPQCSYQVYLLHGNCEQELWAGEPKCWEMMRKGKFLEKRNEISCELSNQKRLEPVLFFRSDQCSHHSVPV